jgi:hypothetical protein
MPRSRGNSPRASVVATQRLVGRTFDLKADLRAVAKCGPPNRSQRRALVRRRADYDITERRASKSPGGIQCGGTEARSGQDVYGIAVEKPFSE